MNSLDFSIKKIKAIIAVGNTGLQYIKTRHNVGFLLVDRLTSDFKADKKFKALIDNVVISNSKVLIAKPTTMMNLSGQSAVAIKQFYKLKNEEILVVHDDLDIQLGEFKIQFAKGPYKHNGIGSIEQMLGDNEFWRIRIGIENRTSEERKLIPGINYVLNEFFDTEFEILNSTFDKIITLLKNINE